MVKVESVMRVDYGKVESVIRVDYSKVESVIRVGYDLADSDKVDSAGSDYDKV